MMKPYLKVELTTKNDQSLIIQEGTTKGVIEIFFREENGDESGAVLY